MRSELKNDTMTLNVLQWLPNKIKNQHVKSVNLVIYAAVLKSAEKAVTIFQSKLQN